MRLESARSLKAELKHKRVHMPTAHGRLRPLCRLGFLPSVEALAAPPIAIGISGHSGRHRIAVRVHMLHPETERMLEQIRRHARGEVDVRVVGQVTMQAVQQTRQRPLRIGDSTANAKTTLGAGTLGCFVARRGKPDEDLVLSNNHVLANENQARKGSTILQPGPMDGGKAKRDAVGRLAGFVTLKKRHNRVDAALASIDEGLEYRPLSLAGLGELAGVREAALHENEPVLKLGRTTGLTRGRVTAYELDDIHAAYPAPLGNIGFDDQIEIAPEHENRPFSLGGDSGSLIVDRELRAVGLLFGGNNIDVTYASPIAAVLEILGVQLAS